MRIVSYNVNGLRAAIKKGLIDWLKENKKIDIFCVQETKSHLEQIPVELFEEIGYNVYWEQAVKKGYSGVATFSKTKATKVVNGIGIKKYDIEGRVLRTDFKDLTVLNIYFPSGSSGEERHKFKVKFLNDLYPEMMELRKKRKKVIVVGDYNVVHKDLDIHNPTRRDNPSGFRPEEREWMTKWFSTGFNDAFRMKNPKKEEFSWWSYRAGSRARNKGWRIDYISVSDALADSVKKSGHYQDAVHSDHCPAWADIKI